MLERFSNILSWGGFLILVVITVVSVVSFIEIGKINNNIDVIMYASIFDGIIATINYLIVGRFRLLPWR